MNPPALAISVTESSQIAEARRHAVAAAQRAGFNETEAGRAAIIATELATNLLKHGGGGEILLSHFLDQGGDGMQVIALDKGPGIADLKACMEDGYSTAGSAGGGLGAALRQSHVFDVFSRPGGGTAVFSRLAAGRLPNQPAVWPAWSGMSLAVKGETECGDSWAVCEEAGKVSVLVADGLGHGPAAAAASQAAVAVFEQYYRTALEDLAGRLHDALRATRGAAVAVARIDPARHCVDFVGIGNIAGTLITTAGARKMISHNGTAGHIARKIQQFSYPYQGRPLVIMHSDGLGTSWSLDRYVGLATHHPGLISAVLYRDFTRGRDDVSVVAVSDSQ